MNDDQAFIDRRHAGRVLASRLANYSNRDDVIVLALPRGGVPVAYEVASALAMGAIATGGVRVHNEDVVRWYGISEAAIERVVREEQEELARRELAYRGDRQPPDLANRIVILIDDGLATGSTMRAAAHAVRAQRPARVIVAVPVGAPQTCGELAAIVDEVICANTPEPFSAVGQWYVNFDQTTDDEVRELLRKSAATPQAHR